ncbi:glycosyltransferase [Paenibacillus dokdonensis]|uniref:Glycosyltransferase n=2 Tax=Paenibacillus dokdonensis TaxID=2567944 RepID=A0ABU6GII9_9BACL|nr:glycosyltransferase [Paenibacillus dokdonensis]MEC0239565.1 glycosyltransferase [Paenibacillus dokdonensis]
MPPQDITLCMIVKNEEKHLDRCLRSVREWVSEIIIGDTGSTDQTQSIAMKYGARIIELEWNNDFAEARNRVLDMASCSWILVLDADEEADNWDADVLSGMLTSDDRIAGFYIPLISYYDTISEEAYITDSVCRLFRNHPSLRFRGAIHENAADSVLELTQRPIPYAPLQIKHYGYLQSEIDQKNKHFRNLELILASLQKDPLNVQLLYALGTEYFQEGQYGESLKHLIPVYEQNPESGFISDVYLKTAYALYMTGHSELAEVITEQGITNHPGFTDLLELKGILLTQKEAYGEAYDWMLKASVQGKAKPMYSSTAGSGTYRTSWLSGRLSEKLLHPERALFHYQHALLLHRDYLPAWADALHCSLLSGNTLPMLDWIIPRNTSILQEQLDLLIPAALNAGREDWLEFIVQTRALSEQRQLWITLMLRYASEPGCRLYTELLDSSSCWPEDPFWLSYLWSAAWKAQDSDAAGHVDEQLQLIHSPLTLIHAYLSGRNHEPPSEKELVPALQLLLQCRAYPQVHQLLTAFYEYSSSLSLPASVIAGLLSAPVHVLHAWCLQWGQSFSGDKQRIPALEEILLYASIAQRCSSSACLDAAAIHLGSYSHNTYALVARAACLTEKSTLRYSIPVKSGIRLPLLLRAATMRP